MNWTRTSKLLRLLGLALLAACLNAGHASAQVFQGKFTLPFQARWGEAALPAGDYSFALDSTTGACTLRLYRQGKGVALIMAQGQSKNDSGTAALIVVRGTVRTLSLPKIGTVLQYAPHHGKRLAAPEERIIAQIVPVVSTGK
ncbi:MAG TPA: hypothetical protein VKM93_26765 [Terriglobia bacterium]|nr:hypothetical protein [Terriglobia bacterium]